jgi:hypothetical protein
MRNIIKFVMASAVLFFSVGANAQETDLLADLIKDNERAAIEKSYIRNGEVVPELEIVAELDFRPGNIAVSQDRRILVTAHPFENYKYAVVEVLADGTTKPYPNEEWSSKPDAQGKGINAAIGISITFEDELFVLDLGSPEHQAKILAWDMKGDVLADTYYIPNHVTTPQSFFQDIGVDWTKRSFFIADMGQADLAKPARPALITLGQQTGYARRLFDSHPNIMPPETPVSVDGKVLKLADGTPVRGALNPITILPMRSWIYFAPMGRGMVYKIRTYHILDEEMSAEELESKMIPIGEKPASDGMTIDAAGNIYITDLESNAIGVMDRKGNYRIYLDDDRIDWADGLAFGADGFLYVTINQLHKSAVFNGGKEEGKPPYYIARFKPLAAGAVGR